MKTHRIRALDNVSLEVHQGEILGILGPNGAGKTTFINILSTLLTPDSGTFQIAGIPGCRRHYSRLRRRINLSSGHPNFPWCLTVRESLTFYGRLYGLPWRTLRSKISNVIEIFDLSAVADQRFDELSSGNKQRLSLAKAFLNEPDVLFLDEPTVGLDPQATARVRELIMAMIRDRGLTVLLTTHNMVEAEMMCQRIAFLKSGRIIRLATPHELKALQGKDNLDEVFIELSQLGDEHLAVQAKIPAQTAAGTAPKEKLSLRHEVMNWLRRCLAFTYRNFIFALRNFFAVTEMLFWPGVTLLSIGLMGDYLTLGAQARTFILTGAIAGGVLQVVQLDVAYSLLYEVWSKSMKHTFMAPLGVQENIFGSWLVGILRGLVVFVGLALAAAFIFDFRFPSLWVTGIFLTGLFFTAILLGSLVSFLVLLFGQKAEITAWMFAYVMMLLGGIYYPITTLPPFFYRLAQWIPVTYFLEYYRVHIGFEGGLTRLLPKGFGLIVFYLMLSHLMMNMALRQARRKGTIIRVSE